jgi:hypothetical protein
MDINYERDLHIDDSALDVEWLEQAELVRRYAKYLSEKRKEVRALEEEKKTVRSELILRANKNPMKEIGKEKPNSNDIEAYYRNHDEYKEIIEELLDAQYELDYAELAYEQINWTRKKALENLVELHGQMYFAGPKIPRDLKDEREKRAKKREESNERVHRKIKRKR